MGEPQIPAWIDRLAMDATMQIEDEFAKGHIGGVVQRRAAIQVLVTAAMVSALKTATASAINFTGRP